MIFVHGIGSQAAGETLREWGGSIIRVLAEFRIDERVPADPVVTTRLDPTTGGSLYIEIELPDIRAADGSVTAAAEHWVMTEAWWAQRVAPPPFAQMAQWLGPDGAVRRIVTAMFAAQGSKDPRQRDASQAHLLARPTLEGADGPSPDTRTTIESPAAHPMLSSPVDIGDTGDAGTEPRPAAPQPGSPLRPGPLASVLERFGVRLFLQAVSALGLLLYGFLRSIEKILPIGPLKDGALTRPIDNFLLDWFGDVYVLLGDPAQSASVRARLVDAIWDLEAIDCRPITIVAHSGGAIVTYLTLADPVTADLRVDRVVTHGEAANLGWRLTDGGAIAPGLRQAGVGSADVYGDLYRSITNRRHPVLWTDMWASQDPAPVGLMNFPGVELPRVESIGVWNRLSFSEDHGTYWDNDEEFVIPLIRRLVGATPARPSSRFGSDEDHERRSGRRRQRVAVLSFWTQFCRSLPTVAIVHAFAVGAGSVFAAGGLATTIWNLIPGHEIISTPVEQVRTSLPNGFAPGSLGDFVAQLGVWVIAAVLASSAIFALRAPPERSALFRGPWTILDIGYAVVLRALVLYLVALAAFRFVNAPIEWRPSAALLVVVVLAVAVGEVGLAWLLARPAGPTRQRLRAARTRLRATIAIPRATGRVATNLRFALPTAFIAGALALSVLLVAAPFVAMAVFPDTANIVLGTIVIFIAFQLLLAVGKWRWMAWDDRERVATQRAGYVPKPSLAVAIQMTIHILAGVLLYFGIIRSDDTVLGAPLIVLSVLTAGAAVLIGIGIDVVSTTQRRAEGHGERVAELIRLK